MKRAAQPNNERPHTDELNPKGWNFINYQAIDDHLLK
jgi:hypothetical protein